MADQQGYIEKRQTERVAARFEVSFHPIEAEEAEKLTRSSGDFKDITAPAPASSRQVKDVMTVVTENISVGGLKIMGPKPFKDGVTLAVEMKIPGLPVPIRALAVVVRTEIVPGAAGQYAAGLRFIALSKDDINKLERYVALQKRAEIERRGGK